MYVQKNLLSFYTLDIYSSKFLPYSHRNCIQWEPVFTIRSSAWPGKFLHTQRNWDKERIWSSLW